MVLSLTPPSQENILASGKLAYFGAKSQVDTFTGDEQNDTFELTKDDAVLGSEIVKVNGVLQFEGQDYTAIHENGILKKIKFTQPPAMVHQLQLNISIWTYLSEELQNYP